MPWQPRRIFPPDKAFKTATDTVRVRTDDGIGFLKALGNHGGPQYLAADLFGTELARWFGLPTFEWAIIEVHEDDGVVFFNGTPAQPGPAFITKGHNGATWGGGADELQALTNPEDIARLVLFDTWTRNCDRHPPDLAVRRPNLGNVFLSTQDLPNGVSRLIAMDHTHCFNCGRDLNHRLAHIDVVKDDRIYGLFPEFRAYLLAHPQAIEAGLARLAGFPRAEAERIVALIPAAWQVETAARAALVELVCARARFLLDHFPRLVAALAPPPPPVP